MRARSSPTSVGTNGHPVMDVTDDLERLDEVRERNEPPADGPAWRHQWPPTAEHRDVVDRVAQPPEIRDRCHDLGAERHEGDECRRSVEIAGLFRGEKSRAGVIDQAQA